jgi:hypothetical protein
MNFIENIFIPKKDSNEFTFDRYLRDLGDGVFREKMCLGICEQNGGTYLLKQFSIEPNALYVGAMGSGKSVAACFSLVTWMLSNSDQTLLFIVDAVKGANDYRSLFKYQDTNQVFPVLSSEVGIHRVIDLIYDEAMARRELFNSVKAESIHSYEKITGKKIARIILMFEEFHSIPYAIMNFERDFKVPLTTANKFHTIMRIGRTMGTWVMAASQKSTKSDIPSEIVPNFTQKQIFRVSRAEAQYILGDSKAADIRSDQKGRCETDYGSVQFPFMPVETQERLLDKYMRPLTAECAYLTPQVIKDYLGGRSTEELYRLKKLSDLVQMIDNIDGEIVVSMLHKFLGHTIESVNSLTDNNALSHVITWKNGTRVAVMTRVGSKIKITKKHVMQLSNGMASQGCSRGILYTSANDLPQALYKDCLEAGIELVDHEDFLRIARQIESGILTSENVSPSELADSSKETGVYQKENNVPDFVAEEVSDKATPEVKIETETKKEDFVEIKKEQPKFKPIKKEIKPILKDLLPVKKNSDSEQIRLSRVKIEPFSPKKDEPYVIMVKTQRTKNNEIFRVLFYLLNKDELKHRYFIDHKISGLLDEETSTKLEVGSVKEWNSQPEALNDASFDQKLVAYLKSFNVCEVPPVVICSDEDRSWVNVLMKKAPGLSGRAVIIEEMTKLGLGLEYSAVISEITPSGDMIFSDVEKLRLVWQIIN